MELTPLRVESLHEILATLILDTKRFCCAGIAPSSVTSPAPCPSPWRWSRPTSTRPRKRSLSPPHLTHSRFSDCLANQTGLQSTGGRSEYYGRDQLSLCQLDSEMSLMQIQGCSLIISSLQDDKNYQILHSFLVFVLVTKNLPTYHHNIFSCYRWSFFKTQCK